jgi:hypothetical protein
MFQKDAILCYVLGYEKLLEIMEGFAPTVEVIGEGLLSNLKKKTVFTNEENKS